MGRIADIAAELTAGHPDTGAYNADDKLAADELNAVNRDADGGVSGMFRYCCENSSRTNVGADTVSTPLIARLQVLADLDAVSPAANFLGGTYDPTSGNVQNAKMLLLLLTSPHLTEISFTGTEVAGVLDDMETAKVWKAADTTALKAISLDQQSRASEIGVGKVWEGNVTDARAL